MEQDHDPGSGVDQAADLIKRAFGPGTEVDRVYVGDITYIPTWEGWAYLATVIDLASRRVVGWAIADHMRTSLVTDAMRWPSPPAGHQPGAIFHSDRGSQYTSTDYHQLARDNGMVLSVGMAGECGSTRLRWERGVVVAH